MSMGLSALYLVTAALRCLSMTFSERLELKGTKVLCREAGCGCCIVTATYLHPSTGQAVTNPVSSCLCPVYSAVGWNVTTIEGLGGQRGKDYHPIQERLADRFGSQCGYCSPGFVMSMFGSLNNNPKPTSKEVEHFFDGNICRCTGYRPILDAMKTFAVDSKDSEARCLDIEDLQKVCCAKNLAKVPTNGLIPLAKGWQGQRFYNPGKLADLLTLLDRHKDETVRLVFGNTSAGIFKEDAVADVYINTRNIPELYTHKETNKGLELGANTSLNELISIFGEVGQKTAGLRHLTQVSEHLQQVANQAVRASGCWAGNLMIKHAHPEFPSDVFILLEASRAVLVVADTRGAEREYRLVDFLQEDMRGRIILSVKLPLIATDKHIFRSYKITPRALNAHAYVNAAFHFAVDQDNNSQVLELPSIVIGGISGKFHHAVKTENYLQNKSLTDQKVVEEAANILESEVVPVDELCASTPEHRRRLAGNLLYKFARGEAGRERHLMHGEQEFKEDINSEFGAPLGKSMPKQEARAQTSGQAMYVNDFPAHKNELFASFVLSPEALIKLKGFGTDKIEKIPGFFRLVTAKDIDNWGYLNDAATTFIPAPYRSKEEILVSDVVSYAGQPVAIVLASDQHTADLCSKLVDIEYESTGEPVVDIREGMIKNSVHMSAPEELVGENVGEAVENSHVKVEGEIYMHEQYHMFMEPINASVQPTEEGLVIYAPHQFPDELVQTMSHILKKPANQLRVVVPRLGGGFGGKLVMVDHIAAACCMCADALQLPVRMYMTLEKNMEDGSKRPALLFKYKAGANKEGLLQGILWDFYSDDGYVMNFNSMLNQDVKVSLDGAFYCPKYSFKRTMIKTNKPQSTSVRAPGTLPATAAQLFMLDHLATELGMDPIDFKRRNLYQPGQMDPHNVPRQNDHFQRMWQELSEAADIKKRLQEIEVFNKAHTFKKRGLDMSACAFHCSYDRPRASVVNLSVQASDGTVNMSHSGIEMGQGLGVKTAQAVAAVLGVDMDKIKIKATDSYVLSNGDATGGSTTSELNVKAGIAAAQNLVEALRPVREQMGDKDASWEAVVAQAAAQGITLHVIGSFKSSNEGRPARYYSTGAGAVEVELDCLTGEYQIRRTDIMMDVGRSLNPGVDIGQIEGSLVMGLGYCLIEKTVYSEDDGRLQSRGTWNYKVPQAADIPRDMRIHILKDSDNPQGVLSTKAIGEPPICLAPVAVTALCRAASAWRLAAGKPAVAHPGKVELPLTPDKVLTDILQVQPADRSLK